MTMGLGMWVLVLFLNSRGGVTYIPMESEHACIKASYNWNHHNEVAGRTACLNTGTGEYRYEQPEDTASSR